MMQHCVGLPEKRTLYFVHDCKGLSAEDNIAALCLLPFTLEQGSVLHL